MSEHKAPDDLYWTLWLKKPIDYGDPAWDIMMLLLIELHAFILLFALIGGMVAMCAKKGQSWHIRGGKIFYYGMLIGAVTGIIAGFIRLTIKASNNHALYINFSAPSTYSARIAFMHSGFTVISMLINTIYGKNFIQQFAGKLQSDDEQTLNISNEISIWWVILLYYFPIFNIIYGIVVLFIVGILYNPFAGASCMIITFTIFNFYNAKFWHNRIGSYALSFLIDCKCINSRVKNLEPCESASPNENENENKNKNENGDGTIEIQEEKKHLFDRLSSILLHEWNMIFLFAYAIWGSLQGHFLGAAVWITNGFLDENDSYEYTGNKRDIEFTFGTVLYLISWIIIFGGGFGLWIKFKKQTIKKYNDLEKKLKKLKEIKMSKK